MSLGLTSNNTLDSLPVKESEKGSYKQGAQAHDWEICRDNWTMFVETHEL